MGTPCARKYASFLLSTVAESHLRQIVSQAFIVKSHLRQIVLQAVIADTHEGFRSSVCGFLAYPFVFSFDVKL